MKDKIFFWLDTEHLYFCLSYYLQKSYNADFYAIIDVPSKTKKFFQYQNLTKFEKTWFLHDNIKKSSEIDYKFLSDFENKYKINLWQLALNERIFYRYNKFYKFNSNEILSILEQECKLFEKILDDAQPTHFITKQTIQHKDHIFFNMCKSRGIKTLVAYVPKTGYGCVISENLHQMDCLEQFNQIKGNKRGFPELRNYLKKHDADKQNRKKLKNFSALNLKKLKAATEFLLLSDNRSSKENFSYYGHSKIKTLIEAVSSTSRKKFRKNFIDNNFQKVLKNELFIYFPLFVDNERENLLAAPFYTNTLEVVRGIAKSIPIEFKLYAKEHPGQSVRDWRSIEEYRKIMQIPNVRVIHPSVSTKDLYEKCSLVISLGGTAGFEAAIFQKPSIIFTDLDYSILPSVTRVNSIEELSGAIRVGLQKKVIAEDIDKYLTLLEKNFIEFDLDGFTLDEFEHFFYGGNLEDVDISIPKMEAFLKLKKSELEKLSEEFIKKI